MEKEFIKQILLEQRDTILMREPGIEREAIKEIPGKLHLPHVCVITGLRRCGKSTFLRQIIKKFYNDSDFFYLTFEDERLFNFKAENFNILLEALIELFGNKKTVFIDEIQNIKNFELFVRRLYDQGYKFFMTGSNAELMSKEIATKLTGRHTDTVLTPFSFTEYLKWNDYNYDKKDIYRTEKRAMIKKHFNEYFYNGGMPEYVKYKNDEILLHVYEDIVIKDIAVRYNVDNLVQLRELYQYMVSNFGRRFSYNSVQRAINTGSVNTVKKFIHYLEQTYFARIINKFDYSTRKQIMNDKKFYLADNGFIQRISVKLNKDTGWLLENLVANALSSISEIFYFSIRGECDFIAVDKDKTINMIQVCSELNDRNKKREINGLAEAMNYFKKNEGLILTYDQEEEIVDEDKKINIIPVWKWLLTKNQTGITLETIL
ncbi:MAG: ATP-binding protein [Bacteroidia bacterium]|nr:ATP-binding protein [Bacteroidia bacterium]